MISSCVALSEGTYTVDESKVFIPFDASMHQLKDRPASLLVDIVPFLIRTKNDLLIIDPGLGYRLPDGHLQIQENLRRQGVEPEEVTLVLLSHLHKDHFGGTCYLQEGTYRLMFPKAQYLIQQGEVDEAFARRGRSLEMDKLEFMVRQPQWVLLQGNGSNGPDIHYEITGGHTTYHQAFRIVGADGEHYFYGGDVLPQPGQLIRRFVAKYDQDGKVSAARRIEFGERAAQEHLICLYFHSAAMPMSRVARSEDGKFSVLPV